MIERSNPGASRIGGAVAAVLFVGIGGGLLYSALQVRDLALDVEELRAKVARAKAPAAPRTEPAPVAATLPSATPQGRDVSADLERLRKELDALKSALGAQPVPSATGGAGAEPAFTIATLPAPAGEQPALAIESMTPDQQEAFKKAVLAVVGEEEKKREAKKREERKNEIVEKLAEKLGLTDTQKDRVQATVDQAAARIEELRKQMNDQNQEQVRDDIRATMTTADDGIRLLLTAEQVTTYEELKTQMNPRRLFGAGGGKNAGQGRSPKR